MTLLDEVRADLGTRTAEILAIDPTTRRWMPTGTTVTVSVLEMGGREAFQMGQEDAVLVWRLFMDLLANGDSPIGPHQRVRLEGKDFNVVNVKRIPREQSEAGAIVDVEYTS